MRPETAFKLLLLLLVLAVPLAFAQKDNATSKYDVSKEINLKGSVEEVKQEPGAKAELGISLLVKTASERVEVRLCPENVLKEFEVSLVKGDQVEITGARIQLDDKEIVLARQVVRGNSTLVLRDKQGAPVWTWMKSSTPVVGK